MKRAMDLILTLGAVSVFIWPCLIVAIILKFSGEGEIFYLQERIGKNRKPFKIFKFATMLKNSPNIGAGDITTGNDPRVLPLGKFLRKTKINELPQFINVLNGSMSLVGPRPFTPKIFDLFTEDYKKILYQLTPGITGIGSIVFRDEEAILRQAGNDYFKCYRDYIVPYKTDLELWYLQNRSLRVDIQILFLTVWAIVAPASDLHFRLFPTLPKRMAQAA